MNFTLNPMQASGVSIRFLEVDDILPRVFALSHDRL